MQGALFEHNTSTTSSSYCTVLLSMSPTVNVLVVDRADLPAIRTFVESVASDRHSVISGSSYDSRSDTTRSTQRRRGHDRRPRREHLATISEWRSEVSRSECRSESFFADNESSISDVEQEHFDRARRVSDYTAAPPPPPASLYSRARQMVLGRSSHRGSVASSSTVPVIPHTTTRPPPSPPASVYARARQIVLGRSHRGSVASSSAVMPRPRPRAVQRRPEHRYTSTRATTSYAPDAVARCPYHCGAATAIAYCPRVCPHHEVLVPQAVTYQPTYRPTYQPTYRPVMAVPAVPVVQSYMAPPAWVPTTGFSWNISHWP